MPTLINIFIKHSILIQNSKDAQAFKETRTYRFNFLPRISVNDQAIINFLILLVNKQNHIFGQQCHPPSSSVDNDIVDGKKHGSGLDLTSPEAIQI